MKRVLDVNGDDAEDTESQSSPKRYATLQNFAGNVFTGSPILEDFSTTLVSTSNDPTTPDEAVSVTTRDTIPIIPSYDGSGQHLEHDLVIGEDRISTNVEPIPAEYGAEEFVLPESIPELSTETTGISSEAEDRLEETDDNLHMYTQPKGNSPTSKSQNKCMILKPKKDKKASIVHKPKPVKPNVGELGNPIAPLQKILDDDCCIIQTLIKRQFTQKSWTDSERISIISGGPPQPIINTMSLFPVDYRKFPWFAGCLDRTKVYCWYCLLFSSMGIWSTSVNHRGFLFQVANKHAITIAHIEAEMLLRHWNSKMNVDKVNSLGTTTGTETKVTTQNDPGTSHEAGSCLIVPLLESSFVQGSWTDEERENIIRRGRPTPKLDSLVTLPVGKPQSSVRLFSESQYKKVPWLAGSEELNKLFCWPCVLFCPQGPWAKVGYGNLNLLTLGIHRHEISQQHLEACLRLKVWEQQVIRKSDVKKVPHEQHNEAVRRNREFMKYLIDVICYFKKKTDNTAVSYEDSMKLITKISSHDAKLKHYLRTRSFFNDEIIGITKSIEACLNQRISKEANCANFVSIILNGVRTKPWISVTLRYVKDNGEVKERFLQFIEFKYGSPINDLLEKVLEAIDFINDGYTLVGFTHDDFAIKPTDLAYFSSRITEKYPSANFFHYGEHNLKTLLQHSLSQMSNCRNFIHGIQDLIAFFERNQIAKTSLTIIDQEMSGEDVNLDYVWNFTSGIIKTVNDHFPAIMRLFERIIRSAVAWNNETVAEAHNFINFLRPLENRFLIATFARILDDIDELTKVMEIGFDVETWKRTAERTSEAVIKTRCEDFEVIFQSAWSMLPSDEAYEYSLVYAEKFDAIMESASLFIHCRTKDLENWSFIELVTNPTFDETSKTGKFNKHFDVLKRLFPLAGFHKLSTQLSFFKGNALFKGKTIDELIKYIYDLDMISALPALHKFSQLMLTVPLYPISTKKKPAITRISSYTNNRKDFTSTDAQMFVEKDLLIELQKEPDFQEDVLTQFVNSFGGEHLKFRTVTQDIK